MCVYTESVDGILHGTEALEQNYVPLHTRTESTDRLSVFCRGKKNCIIVWAINPKIYFRLLIDKREDDEGADLFLVNLAVAAADPVSCALQTEPKESGNAEYRGQSDCPECEAVPAMPPWKSL